jgi:hypothetical protein
METKNTLPEDNEDTSVPRLACNTSLGSQPKPATAGCFVQAHKDHEQRRPSNVIATPVCHNMAECSSAAKVRARLNRIPHPTDGNITPSEPGWDSEDALSIYLSYGLAYTAGSALESVPPPSEEICLDAFLVPNKAGLTAGARAWSKHAHRSGNASSDMEQSLRWWGTPSGPVMRINERALELFWRVWKSATWRNLHWLPHQILVYEIRVSEGYGMRWAQDHGRVYDTVGVDNSVGDRKD